jgi:hypothetical protein
VRRAEREKLMGGRRDDNGWGEGRDRDRDRDRDDDEGGRRHRSDRPDRRGGDEVRS